MHQKIFQIELLLIITNYVTIINNIIIALFIQQQWLIIMPAAGKKMTSGNQQSLHKLHFPVNPSQSKTKTPVKSLQELSSLYFVLFL